jgi:cytochrome P450
MVAIIPTLVGVVVVLALAFFAKQLMVLRGFKGLSVVGWMRSKRNPVDVFIDMVRADPEVKFLKLVFPGFPSVVAVHPESVKWVLSQPDLFAKNQVSINPKFDSLFLHNVVNSNGDEWRKFRTPLTPPFAFDMVKGWVDDFAFYANRLMNYWHEKVQQGKSTVDLLYWLPVFTLDVLGHTAFSYDFKAINYESDDNLKALQYVLHAFEDKVQMMVLVLEMMTGISIGKKFAKECMQLQNFIGKIIQQKKNGAEKPENSRLDIVDTMIKAGFTDDEITSNAFVLFVAGHETTSTALTWMFYHLGKHPEMLQRAIDEVKTNLNGKAVTYEGFKQLPYVQMLIKENMRLEPPASMLVSRVAKEDTEYEGQRIPKGTMVGIGIKQIHHNPAFYENPEEFNPERFDPAKKQPHPFAYLPFSLKSRACLGNQFSLVEQTVFVVTLLQHFKWSIGEFKLREGMTAINGPAVATVKLEELNSAK